MLQPCSLIHVYDNSGVNLVKCFKNLTYQNNKTYPFLIKVSVQEIKAHRKTLIKKGQIYNALIIKSRYMQPRFNGQQIKFDKNGYVTGAEKTLEKIKKSKSTQEYDAIKEAFDQYVEDMYENIPKAENEWWKLEQEIKENERQIKETTKAMNDLVNSAKVDKLTRQFDVLSNSLDILDLKMERAYGANKIDYMQQQLDILTSMKNKNQEIINQNTELLNDSKKQLAQYGITFDEDGNIDNLSSALKKLDNLQDMEDLQDLVDEYNDYKDSIDDASKSIEEETNKKLELKD